MNNGKRWPLTLIRRGERIGSSRPDYIWWQELPADQSAEEIRSVGYEVVAVVPVSDLEALAQELERRATPLRSPGPGRTVLSQDMRHAQALNEAAQLVRAKIEVSGELSQEVESNRPPACAPPTSSEGSAAGTEGEGEG